MNRMIRVGICLVAMGISMGAMAQQRSGDCPPAVHAYGPFDYRRVPAESKHLVESAHFTPGVEQLVKGNTGALGADLDYTLRAIPNHPRALLSMMRLFERYKGQKPPTITKDLFCYFEEALYLYPDDGTAHMLFGIALLKRGKYDQSIKELELSAKLNDSDPNVFYNMGLAYFDMKKYDLSLLNAQKAYQLGFPLPGLQNKLKGIGKWQDPAPRPVAEVSPTQSAPAANNNASSSTTSVSDASDPVQESASQPASAN